jgi:uncharacterized protein (TIGR03086 family)
MDVELLAAASAEFERVVTALPDNSWQLPTPCEVSVRELVEHVVEGNRFAVAVLAGAGAAEAWAAVRAQANGPEAVRESAADQLAAFRQAADDQTIHHPGGDITAEAFLRYRLVDVVVHAWDLLSSAGLDDTLDAAVVEGLWALVEPKLTEMLTFGSYGDGPSGTPQASAQSTLLDAFGRQV